MVSNCCIVVTTFVLRFRSSTIHDDNAARERSLNISTCSVFENGFDATEKGNIEFMDLGITKPVGE